MVDQYCLFELPEYIEGDLFATDREGVDRDGRTLDRRRVNGFCADHAGFPVLVRHFSLFSSKLLISDSWVDRVGLPASEALATSSRPRRLPSPTIVLPAVGVDGRPGR